MNNLSRAKYLREHGRLPNRMGAASPGSGGHIEGLNTLGWTSAQKVAVQSRASAVHQLPPYLHPELTLFLPPADSKAFIVTPSLFVNYPAPGAAAATVISYTAPQGMLAVINKLAIVHNGGNPPDGNGNVIWSVQVNGAGVKGLNQITSQVGTYAAPNDTEILLYEGDVAVVTVQVVVLVPQPPLAGTTAARFAGWTYPLSEAILPQSFKS